MQKRTKYKLILLITFLLLAIASSTAYLACSISDTKLDTSIHIDKIVVEKSKRKMYLYANNQLIKTYKIALGKHPRGGKKYEGDKKTPEGLYIINSKNPKSEYYKNLGISYPNKKDKEEAEKDGKNPGGDIKIHGLKNGWGWIGQMHLLTDWTAGCIAITNKNMDELYAIIEIGTPIEIKP